MSRLILFGAQCITFRKYFSPVVIMRNKINDMFNHLVPNSLFPRGPPHHSHSVKKIKFELGNISLE